ncbi:flagellar biosynthesis protein FlhF [Tumebacillus sp. DT12]|uniref:Flagellar biosynthesis protein FlhF n=1 Tax=Tumebacillus lacus TaxID=2995335 RepID=A0ABT3X1F8_9BACL|nr:flagellar biosynthesis protein FlhF [Tumebacillus lacus]MCX7568534.1 flagellar biosynthesis protein FlhF [Tumebacillus lacus]
MLVKRYLVKEMPEAVALIREDLGKDAVILSTKKVQSRGFFGLFAKSQIEVVAAANDVETAPPARKTTATAVQERPAPAALPAGQVARPAALGAYQQAANPSSATAVAEPERPIPAPVSVPVAVQMKPMSAELADRDEVLKEVQELRSLLRGMLKTASVQSMLPESVLSVRRQLIENDVDEEVVDGLIERGIKHFHEVNQISEQEFRGILTKFIKEELDAVAQPSQISATTRVCAFVGPTGVGKTTTIAKLAAEQVLTRGKRVGLITADTYRIAAVEQLRTYANILNVPLEVCYSPEDAQRALERLADRDLILVDTAGRNYGDLLNVNELNTYLQVLKPDETYFVVSLTTKPADLLKIVNNFSQVDIHKFLFTKLDETRTYGSIYNLVSRYQIPLSYLATGQNVPDDIEAVSTEKLAKLIVGEECYE